MSENRDSVGLVYPSNGIFGKITVPCLFSGFAYKNGMDDFNKINHVPVFVGNLNVGHGGTYSQPHGGDFARVAVQWFKWQLKDDRTAGSLFTGFPCGLSKWEGWTVDKKNIP